MRKFRKLLSILLIATMILPLVPIGEIKAYAADPEIEAIRITKTSNNLGDWETSTVQVRGKYIDGISVGYIESAGDEMIQLVQIPGANIPGIKQFRMPNDKTISEIYVNGRPYNVQDTDMPRINNANPKRLDLRVDTKKIELGGVNFSKFEEAGSGTTIDISNIDVTKMLKDLSDTKFSLNEEVIDRIKHGNKDIVIKRHTTASDGVKIEMHYNQKNAFRIFETINIDKDNISIYPNKGPRGSKMTVTLNGTSDDYSVFFLDTENQLFKYEFMGEEQIYQQTTENKKIIDVKIPKGLKVGTTYKVFITNNLKSKYDESKTGDDLTEYVYMQQNIGEFYVVDASVGPMIHDTDPKEGTSNGGTSVTVRGYRLDELDVDELKRGNTTDGEAVKNLDVLSSRIAVSNGEKLEITYGVSDLNYNGVAVESITRQFGVSIGRDVIFEKVEGKEYFFRDEDDGLDELYVKTQLIEPKDLENPKKDVVVEIKTTIKAGPYTLEIIETPSYDGYTFLRAYQEPIIESIKPDKIQVDGASRKIKETTILSIKGEGFSVFRYNQGGQMRTNYPNVVIGGTKDTDAEILIEKDWNGDVWYTTKENTRSKIPGAILEVLDRNGNIVTGVGGNEKGSFIAITVPKDLAIRAVSLNKDLPVAVVNPKRDSSGKGDIYSYKRDIIQFVTNVSNPTITSLKPSEDTVSGGAEITLEGKNLLVGVEVYIAGVKVEGVKRETDDEGKNAILTFKAPPGRKGETILQVINPDGGTVTATFGYREDSGANPRITAITPPIGTKDDVIIIKGSDFLKANPTNSDILEIIGTKVFLGEEEVNQYASGGGLVAYNSPQGIDENLLIVKEDPFTRTTKIDLSPHYRQATVVDVNNSPYKISKNRSGNVALIGKNKTYTFELEDGQIVATDGSEHYTVKQEKLGKQEIILTSSSGEDILTVEYNYYLLSSRKDQFGRDELKVADYYDSIILDSSGTYYKINKDELGRVTITDESENTYEIRVNGDKVIAIKGSESHDLEVGSGYLKFDDKIFNFKTPYYFDPTTRVIAGHRVRVINASEIEITVPEKQKAGPYDVRVQNPDTKSFTVKNGFTYTIPQENPIINYINPAEGSVDGGYYITIEGENFGNNPEVRIHGTLVSKANTTVNKQDYKSIKVLVPKYTDTPFATDKKYVRVHVTSGGASASRNDLFAYKVASSNPNITRIRPGKGNATGGNVVEIEGTDFRFFEPYKGDPPSSNYEDIDGNGEWTNYLNEGDLEGIPLNDPTIKDYTSYVDSPVLPSIYFGDNKARIVEFTKLSGDSYRIMVLAPPSSKGGAVDVYLKNNDSGQSNAVKYNYESSNPNIKVINPGTGRIVGGESIDLVGTGYRGSKIKLIGPTKYETDTTMYLVRFGEITNRNIPRENDNSGLIKGPVGAKVELKDSGFTAEIKGEDLNLTLKQGENEYKGSYKLKNGIKYIDLKGLKTSNNIAYPGFELVKVEIDDGRLLVDRGFAPTVEERVSGTLEITSPSYHQTGSVNVTLVNPDGISNKVQFNYVSPGSNPKITNIEKDGAQPVPGDGGKTRVVKVNAKGGNTIKVTGSDFRPNPTITIGNDFITIPPSAIEFISETELSFTMPPVTDENKLEGWHNLIVKNEDNGIARSDKALPTPIYIEFSKGESDPTVGNLSPDRGPATGGTKVTITGGDFREKMENYDGKLKVFFGEVEITDVQYNNYGSITVVSPPSAKLGPVPVRIENPDGTQTTENLTFTYISKPKIKDIDPKKLFTNDTKTVVTLTGEQFLSGAKVIIGGKIIPTKDLKSDMVLNGSGITGVDKDGNNIESSVVGGTETATVVVENDGTIKITFKESVDLENTSIIIINSDGGISEPYNDFKHEKPVPLKPMVLEALAGYESTVKLIWSKSDEKILNKASKYEIYGRKTSDKENTFLGDTSNADFLVKALEPNTEYEFLVRALNEHGAAIDFATVKVKTLSVSEDKKLKEKEEKRKAEENKIKTDGKEEMQGDRLVITLGTKNFKNGLGTLDLSLAKYKDKDKMTISIPIALGRTDNRLTIKEGTMTTVINVKDLYTLQVSRLDKGDKDAYLRIHMDRTIEQHIPRGKRAASKAYELYFDYIYGKDSIIINEILRNGKLSLTQNTIVYPTKKNTSLYVYNVETGNYVNIKAMNTDIKGKKKVILLSDR